jgi:hypothetical protein
MREDFECFGPPATADGEFENCMLADLGCFNQQMIDSNKYYHAAVVKSKKNGTWYAYFEWGRTGATAPDFLFTECFDKAEAQAVMAKQLHSKNDKRGEWATIAGRQSLRAKKNKDCYLVRPAARRTTGLPDAQKIIHDDRDDSKKPAKKTAKKAAKKTAVSRWDRQTLELGRALNGATIDFTRKSFAGAYVPTQGAINDARDILAEAMKQVKVVGDNTTAQVNDATLIELTSHLYGIIPKRKPLKVAESEWILSQDNIQVWQFDLDAFEAALFALDTGADDDEVVTDDPFSEFDLQMRWMDQTTREGAFVREWMPGASADRHYHVGNMIILNTWALRQPSLSVKFSGKVDQIAGEKSSRRESPKFQPRSRSDLDIKDRKRFSDANVATLFHGTRSVNVSGILRTGLKLPRQLVGVQITGAMFGPGIYWADDWRKSDGYTSREGGYYAGGSGGIPGRGAFMFVANVALGTPYVASTWGGYTKPPAGYHSVAGLAGRSGLANNEFIVYDASQNDLGYLVEYKTKRTSRW